MSISNSNSKHTPGPWEIAEVDGKALPGRYVRTRYSEGRIGIALVGWHDREANARLIAAAPEMLEALRDCESSLDFAAKALEVPALSAFMENLNRARAILAKVDGN